MGEYPDGGLLVEIVGLGCGCDCCCCEGDDCHCDKLPGVPILPPSPPLAPDDNCFLLLLLVLLEPELEGEYPPLPPKPELSCAIFELTLIVGGFLGTSSIF